MNIYGEFDFVKAKEFWQKFDAMSYHNQVKIKIEEIYRDEPEDVDKS